MCCIKEQLVERILGVLCKNYLKNDNVELDLIDYSFKNKTLRNLAIKGILPSAQTMAKQWFYKNCNKTVRGKICLQEALQEKYINLQHNNDILWCLAGLLNSLYEHTQSQYIDKIKNKKLSVNDKEKFIRNILRLSNDTAQLMRMILNDILRVREEGTVVVSLVEQSCPAGNVFKKFGWCKGVNEWVKHYKELSPHYASQFADEQRIIPNKYNKKGYPIVPFICPLYQFDISHNQMSDCGAHRCAGCGEHHVDHLYLDCPCVDKSKIPNVLTYKNYVKLKRLAGNNYNYSYGYNRGRGRGRGRGGYSGGYRGGYAYGRGGYGGYNSQTGADKTKQSNDK